MIEYRLVMKNQHGRTMKIVSGEVSDFGQINLDAPNQVGSYIASIDIEWRCRGNNSND